MVDVTQPFLPRDTCCNATVVPRRCLLYVSWVRPFNLHFTGGFLCEIAGDIHLLLLSYSDLEPLIPDQGQNDRRGITPLFSVASSRLYTVMGKDDRRVCAPSPLLQDSLIASRIPSVVVAGISTIRHSLSQHSCRGIQSYHGLYRKLPPCCVAVMVERFHYRMVKAETVRNPWVRGKRPCMVPNPRGVFPSAFLLGTRRGPGRLLLIFCVTVSSLPNSVLC